MKGWEKEEEELTQAARKAKMERTPENIDALVTKARPLLLEFARKLPGVREATAEDIVQDVLLVLLAGALQIYNEARPFAPLLYGIAHRKAIDDFRKRKRETSGGEFPEPAINDPSEILFVESIPRCWRQRTLEDAMLLVLSAGDLPHERVDLVNDLDTFVALIEQTRTLDELMIILGQPDDRRNAIKAKLARARRGLLECLDVL